MPYRGIILHLVDFCNHNDVDSTCCNLIADIFNSVTLERLKSVFDSPNIHTTPLYKNEGMYHLFLLEYVVYCPVKF